MFFQEIRILILLTLCLINDLDSEHKEKYIGLQCFFFFCMSVYIFYRVGPKFWNKEVFYILQQIDSN